MSSPLSPQVQEWRDTFNRLLEESCTLAYAAGQNYIATGEHTNDSMIEQALAQEALVMHAMAYARIAAAPQRQHAVLPGERRLIDANELERIAKERPDEYFLKGSGVLKLIGGIRQLEATIREMSALAASPQPVPVQEPHPLNGVPATMRHDEGAYARCHYCRRYSLDPNTLSDDSRQPMCDCGKQHGWSGSFEKPGPDAVWSGRAPQPVRGEALPAEQPKSDQANLTAPVPSEDLPPALPRWIPVSERLPECDPRPGSLGVQVFISPRWEGECTAYYGKRVEDCGGFYKYGAVVTGVTHWAAL